MLRIAPASTTQSFATRVLARPDIEVPKAIVLDVGFIADIGWAVVEMNGAWGSGYYGCDPAACLEVIRHATVQKTR